MSAWLLSLLISSGAVNTQRSWGVGGLRLPNRSPLSVADGAVWEGRWRGEEGEIQVIGRKLGEKHLTDFGRLLWVYVDLMFRKSKADTLRT
jgi:hypothetical protein